MIGDVLRANFLRIKMASPKKASPNALWVIIRDIAREEILREYPNAVDSDVLVSLYYNILRDNVEWVPRFYREILKSNKQERYRVVVRNVLTSNAFHSDGLANQPGIRANKTINEGRKGRRIVYRGEQKYVDSDQWSNQ